MDKHSLVLQIESYMRDQLPRYLDELQKLCAIDSGSSHKAGLDEMARYLAARMDDLGMATRIIERDRWGNDLIGSLRGRGKGKILLLGHTDTVYPVGIAAANPPMRDGNSIFGPGVCDMKGGLLSGIYAIESLLKVGIDAFGEIRFVCVSDEEITTRHSKDVLHEAYCSSDAALVLEAARENGAIVSARKGIAWYTLTARGRAAHAGTEPEKGRNAIVELAHQISRVWDLNGWREGVTINPAVIEGGVTPNTVPALAQLRLDLRYVLPEDRIATEERIRHLFQEYKIAGVELELQGEAEFRDPLVCTPQSLELAEIAQELALSLGFTLEHVLTGGTSDANYAFDYGIPVLDGLGPIGGNDHSPNEYLLVDSIVPRTTLLAGLIATIGTQSTGRKIASESNVSPGESRIDLEHYFRDLHVELEDSDRAHPGKEKYVRTGVPGHQTKGIIERNGGKVLDRGMVLLRNIREEKQYLNTDVKKVTFERGESIYYNQAGIWYDYD